MKNPEEQEKYNDLFWTFWKQEIPNVIQILTLPSFFGILIKNYSLDLSLFLLTVLLLRNYTNSKMYKFISEKYPMYEDPSHPKASEPLDSRWNFLNSGSYRRNNTIMAFILTFGTALVVLLVSKN